MDAEGWIRAHVAPAGSLVIKSEKPWATVWRVPLAGGAAFFKACQSVQAFEPRLTAALASRWPDRIPEVLAWDEERAWLLLGDAGAPLMILRDQLDPWFVALPLYAELQAGEALRVSEHLAGGVPDRRLVRLPGLFAELPLGELPLREDEADRVHAFEPCFAELCASLGSAGIPDSVQHDDLHGGNVWRSHNKLRILDWGDACISHPFCTLADTFRLFEHYLALTPSDPIFTRLSQAYLEPWGGSGLRQVVSDALIVGTFARAIGGLTYRAIVPADRRESYDEWLCSLLRRGLALASPQTRLLK